MSARDRYGLREWTGAFGDLGTLLRFLLAGLLVVKMEPAGVLFGFGAAMIAVTRQGW